MPEVLPKPPWLDDEKEVKQLLRWFIERAIKNPQRSDKPLRKTLMDNFLPKSEAGNLSWTLLNKLTQSKLSPALLTIKTKSISYDVEWNGASVYCPQQSIAQLMDWLDYQVDDSLSVWQRDVDDAISAEEAANLDVDFLKLKLLSFPGKKNLEVIRRLKALAKVESGDKTLRELSANYFWGDSKFLESRSSDWLGKTLPQLHIQDRKVEVNFYLPRSYNQVLFVENLDTYHQLIQKQPVCINHYAIVYASGFRLSASRIREVNSVSLHQSRMSKGGIEAFESFWFDKESVPMPSFFWGDFDFSAMAILKSLRSNFSNMQLWQPGYEAMKMQVEAERGHTVSLRDKHAQIDPNITGCDFADNIILPMLRQLQFCYDQEGINLLNL